MSYINERPEEADLLREKIEKLEKENEFLKRRVEMLENSNSKEFSSGLKSTGDKSKSLES
jgi:cell division protein FtsB